MKRIKLLSLSLACMLFISGCSLSDKGESVLPYDEEVMDLAESTDNPIELGGSDNQIDEVLSVVGDVKFDVSDSHLVNSVKILDTAYCSENIMISPLSLDFVLGMIANGADDNTRKNYEMYFGQSIDEFNAFSKSYLSDLSSVVEIANGVFVDNTYTINDDTNAVLEQNYLSKVYSLDFDSIDSVNFVNNWCSESTHGMIDRVVNDLSGYESVLANALYFKDLWLNAVAHVDENSVFTNIKGESEVCAMMSFDTNTYFENDKAIGFMKQYTNNDYGFVVILPKIEGEFSVYDLDIDGFLASKTNCMVKAELPEFSFGNQLSLTNVLKTLGLDVFEHGVYNKLINETDMVLSEVLQSTKVTVDRNGTEASSVTVGLMSNTSVGSEPVIQYVSVDRPFAFMIYDFENNVPLFMGKVISIK